MRLPALVLLIANPCVPVLVSEDDTGPDDCSWEAPENSWPVATPPECLEGEGFYVDQTVPDFRLTDQHDDTTSLWQFTGMVTVLDISTMWCRPCQQLAETTEEVYQERLGDGFMYVTVLAENIEGSNASVEDLNIWATEYGITAPVVTDPDKIYSGPAIGTGSYPLVLVIDRDLVIRTRTTAPTDEELVEAIDHLLDE